MLFSSNKQLISLHVPHQNENQSPLKFTAWETRIQVSEKPLQSCPDRQNTASTGCSLLRFLPQLLARSFPCVCLLLTHTYAHQAQQPRTDPLLVSYVGQAGEFSFLSGTIQILFAVFSKGRDTYRRAHFSEPSQCACQAMYTPLHYLSWGQPSSCYSSSVPVPNNQVTRNSNQQQQKNSLQTGIFILLFPFTSYFTAKGWKDANLILNWREFKRSMEWRKLEMVDGFIKQVLSFFLQQTQAKQVPSSPWEAARFGTQSVPGTSPAVGQRSPWNPLCSTEGS